MLAKPADMTMLLRARCLRLFVLVMSFQPFFGCAYISHASPDGCRQAATHVVGLRAQVPFEGLGSIAKTVGGLVVKEAAQQAGLVDDLARKCEAKLTQSWVDCVLLASEMTAVDACDDRMGIPLLKPSSTAAP